MRWNLSFFFSVPMDDMLVVFEYPSKKKKKREKIQQQ